MKGYVLCILFGLFAYTQQQGFQAVLHLNKDVCVEESQVDPAILEKIKTDHSSIPDDPKFKCFLKCLFVKVNGMTDEGKIRFDEHDPMIAAIPPQYLEPIKKCKDVQGADGCETAYEFLKCFKENEKSG